MKRIIVLLSMILLLTGCEVHVLDNSDLGKNVKLLLSDDIKVYNTYFTGYKLYVPKGMKLDRKEDYNLVFVDKYGIKYYLYIDVISYFHKTENNYEVNDKIHYSNKLDYNGKTGYINIVKDNDKFYVQFMYNYAKMEAYVKEKDLAKVVNNMCYILRSVKFNDDVLESLMGENILSYKEENFTLFEQEHIKEDFLEVAGDNTNVSSSKKDTFVNDEEIKLDESN